MKKVILFVLLVLCMMSTMVTAQVNVEEVMEKCPLCHGSGQTVPFVDCFSCKGLGVKPKPEYETAGRLALSRGKQKLVKGDYEAAFEEFNTGMNNCNFEAVTYMGACLELGMGRKVNYDLALQCYELAAQYKDPDAKAALSRIQSSGFWPATENMREQFRNSLNAQMHGIASPMNGLTQPNGNVVPPMNTYQEPGNTGGNLSNKYTCKSCNGTGLCSLCKGAGGYMVRGINEEVWKTCSMCSGFKECKGCSGKGFIW